MNNKYVLVLTQSSHKPKLILFPKCGGASSFAMFRNLVDGLKKRLHVQCMLANYHWKIRLIWRLTAPVPAKTVIIWHFGCACWLKPSSVWSWCSKLGRVTLSDSILCNCDKTNAVSQPVRDLGKVKRFAFEHALFSKFMSSTLTCLAKHKITIQGLKKKIP